MQIRQLLSSRSLHNPSGKPCKQSKMRYKECMCCGTTGKEILMMVSEPRTRLEKSLSKEGEVGQSKARETWHKGREVRTCRVFPQNDP